MVVGNAVAFVGLDDRDGGLPGHDYRGEGYVHLGRCTGDELLRHRPGLHLLAFIGRDGPGQVAGIEYGGDYDRHGNAREARSPVEPLLQHAIWWTDIVYLSARSEHQM